MILRTMKLHIDLKSAALGLLAGIIVTLTVGATAKPTGPIGRFQIEVGQQNAFVIDTATGEVWRGHGNSGVSPNFSNPKLDLVTP
jgi:hypothetical protein